MGALLSEEFHRSRSHAPWFPTLRAPLPQSPDAFALFPYSRAFLFFIRPLSLRLTFPFLFHSCSGFMAGPVSRRSRDFWSFGFRKGRPPRRVRFPRRPQQQFDHHLEPFRGDLPPSVLHLFHPAISTSLEGAYNSSSISLWAFTSYSFLWRPAFLWTGDIRRLPHGKQPTSQTSKPLQSPRHNVLSHEHAPDVHS